MCSNEGKQTTDWLYFNENFKIIEINDEMEIDNCDNDKLTLAKRNILLYSSNESDVQFSFRLEPNRLMLIHAHKRILAIGSCVFEQMFYGMMASYSKEANEIIYIADIPFECFKNLLMFIYIGAIELNLDNVFEVMYAAHKYEVCKLESLCCDFLYKNMDISNVFEIYDSSLVYNNSITKQCAEWIDDLFDDLVRWEGFMNLKKGILMEILQRDTLNITELNLFKSVYKWAEKQCYDASLEPSDLNLRKATDNFKQIRFPTMLFGEFAECLRYGVNILTVDEKVDIWDAIAKVKESNLFNSKKRILSQRFKAFSFRCFPSVYVAHKRYTFQFEVRRIVYLTSIKVIRNCTFQIAEKELGDTLVHQGYKCFIHANETKSMNYMFVPNVKYALITIDHSFGCSRDLCLHCVISPKKFSSYNDMQTFFNQAAKVFVWSFEEHDPFHFDSKQETLIRLITYRLRK